MEITRSTLGRISDDASIHRDIPSFIEPRPPLILNPFMRPKPVKKTNLLDLFEEEDSELEDLEFVQVYLRIKPCEVISSLYEVQSDKCLITSLDTATAGHGRRTQHNVSKMYTFSHIFRPEASQKEIFEHVVKDNLRKLADGQNYTLLTYGASGSGKTFTLMGTVTSPGLVPRSLEYVFKVVDAAQQPLFKPSDSGAEQLNSAEQDYEMQWVKKLRHISAPLRNKYRRMSAQLSGDMTTSQLDLSTRTRYYVWVSFVEIYNEAVYDLLVSCDRRSANKLRIREDPSGHVYVKDATQAFVRSGAEAYDVMVAGKHNLQVAATGVHARSSRSHCIFTITMLAHTDEGVRVSTVRLCDLAGAERIVRTNNVGARLKESRAINASLHVLERCLHALRRKRRQPGLVPYRESKLTRLLGAGLSGARGEAVSMVVTVNPEPALAAETRHVLQLAAVARDIQVNSTTAESMLELTSDSSSTVCTSAEVMRLRADNERLHFELAQLQAQYRELLSTSEDRQQRNAETMREVADEAKDMMRQYYEAQMEAAEMRHASELEDLKEEYENKLRALDSSRPPRPSGTPSRAEQKLIAQLSRDIAILEEKLTVEKLARDRAEDEAEHLRECIEERDHEKLSDDNASTKAAEDVMLLDSEQSDDDINDSLEPSFAKDNLNATRESPQSREVESVDEDFFDSMLEPTPTNSIIENETTVPKTIVNDSKLINPQKSIDDSGSTIEPRESIDTSSILEQASVNTDISNAPKDLNDISSFKASGLRKMKSLEKEIFDSRGTYVVLDEENVSDLPKVNETKDLDETRARLDNMTSSFKENTEKSFKTTDSMEKEDNILSIEATAYRKIMSFEKEIFDSRGSYVVLDEENVSDLPRVNETKDLDETGERLNNMTGSFKENTEKLFKTTDSMEKENNMISFEAPAYRKIMSFEKEIFASRGTYAVVDKGNESSLPQVNVTKDFAETEESLDKVNFSFETNIGIAKPSLNNNKKSVKSAQSKRTGTRSESLLLFEQCEMNIKEEIVEENRDIKSKPQSIPKIKIHRATMETSELEKSSTTQNDDKEMKNDSKIDSESNYYSFSPRQSHKDATENTSHDIQINQIKDVEINKVQTNSKSVNSASENASEDNRSPSIVKEEIPKDYNPVAIKKIYGERVSKSNISVDVFDDPNSLAMQTCKELQENVQRMSLDEDITTKNSVGNHEASKDESKVNQTVNNTVEEFEKLYKDVSNVRATEFEMLVTENSNIADQSKAVSPKRGEVKKSVRYNLRHEEEVNKKYNLRHKTEIDEEKTSQTDHKPKKCLRLRRQKNQDDQVEEKSRKIKLKDIANLQKEFSDVTLGVPAEVKPEKDIPSPEKNEGENCPPNMETMSCPAKRPQSPLPNDMDSNMIVTRSRRKLFTPRAEPLEESLPGGGGAGAGGGGESGERVCVPRPSYHRARARRKL